MLRVATYKCQIALLLLIPLLAGITFAESPKSQILWDTYGVPHIWARDIQSAGRAFGYAQMQGHGDLVLRLYGMARARGAEYWGERYADEDRWLLVNSVPERAKRWYQMQTPAFRNYLDAFASGINEYSRLHPEDVSNEVKVVLPVTAVDVLAHVERVVNYNFVVDAGEVQREIARGLPAAEKAGSNGWAISPSHTSDGHAMLLANPHLPWDDFFRFQEVQLNAPGLSIYGAALVGVPVVVIGFNNDIGWTHTINPIDTHDVYELTLSEGGYKYDGAIRNFEVEHTKFKVKQDDGNIRTENLIVRRSVHGPVISEKSGKAYALRVADLENWGACQEWFDLAQSHNLAEFEKVLRRLQIPMFNILYAGRDGHVLYLFNGLVPARTQGDSKFWSGVVPGDTSKTFWNGTLPYNALPKLIDPPSGWVQNTNDPPWSSTYPPVLNPTTFPAFLAPPAMSLRTQKSIQMLLSNPRLSFDALISDKHSTRSELGDRVVDDLIIAARDSGDDRARVAGEVLARWDHTTDASSRGAVLFLAWAQRWLTTPDAFATPWTNNSPLDTPRGIANPRKAVKLLSAAADDLAKRGALDVSWGEVNRFKDGSIDLPGNGGPDPLGIFRAVEFGPDDAMPRHAMGGDSFVALIEFSTPLRAQVVLAPGNSTQPSSRHRSDQLRLLAEKRMRTPWLTMRDVESHLEHRDKFN